MLGQLRSPVLYLGFAGFAVVTAMSSEFHGYRVWGAFAAVAYLVAVVCRERLAVWAALGLGCAAPLAVLIFNRNAAAEDFTNAPWNWSAQPDVWVIERSARLLLAHGIGHAVLKPLVEADVRHQHVEQAVAADSSHASSGTFHGQKAGGSHER